MFSRRKFLGAAATAAGASTFAKSAFAAERADVVIIGAGLSGLNAALALKAQSFRTILLEANSRVGGRVCTLETSEGLLDVGASEVGRGYARVLDACQRFGIQLIPEDRDLLKFGAHFKDSWVDNDTWASNPLNKTVGEERAIPPMMVASRLLGKYNPLTGLEDWLNPKYAADDVSLRTLLKRNGHSDAAIELAAMATPGISIDETSVLRMWQEDTRSKFDRRFGPPASADELKGVKEHPFGEANVRNPLNGLASISNMVGGCHVLPLKMAAALGDDVRLNKAVASIDLTDTGGTVTCTDGSSYKARFIISAIPFTMLRKVAITPGQSGSASQAIAKMPYANTARAYLTIDEPFWLNDGLPPSFQTDGPMGMFWAIDNHNGAGAHRGMIVLTGPQAQAISKMKPTDVEPMFMAQMAALRPASVGKIRIHTYKDWGRDPYIGACGFSLAPGQVNGFARDMLTPWKVMHFAGEHTRRLDFGMESAMESGERAAFEVIARA